MLLFTPSCRAKVATRFTFLAYFRLLFSLDQSLNQPKHAVPNTGALYWTLVNYNVLPNAFYVSYAVWPSFMCLYFCFFSSVVDRVLKRSHRLKGCELKVSLAPLNKSPWPGGPSVAHQVHCSLSSYLKFMYNFPFVQYSACLSFCVFFFACTIVYVFMYICMLHAVCMYVCMYVCMCWVCVCVYVCMYVCVCICVRSCYAMLCYAMLCYAMMLLLAMNWLQQMHAYLHIPVCMDIQVGIGGWIFIYNTYLSLLLRI